MAPKVVIALPCSSFKRQVRAKAKTTLLIACKFKYRVSVPPGKTQTQRPLCVSTYLFFFFSPEKATEVRCLSLPAKHKFAIPSYKVRGTWTTPRLLISTALGFIACQLLLFTAISFLSLPPLPPTPPNLLLSSLPEPPCQRLTYWSLHAVPSSHTQAPSKIKLRTFVGRQTHDDHT